MYSGITRDVILHEQRICDYLDRVETFTLDTEGNIKVNVVLGGQGGVSSINVGDTACLCVNSSLRVEVLVYSSPLDHTAL